MHLLQTNPAHSPLSEERAHVTDEHLRALGLCASSRAAGTHHDGLLEARFPEGRIGSRDLLTLFTRIQNPQPACVFVVLDVSGHQGVPCLCLSSPHPHPLRGWSLPRPPGAPLSWSRAHQTLRVDEGDKGPLGSKSISTLCPTPDGAGLAPQHLHTRRGMGTIFFKNFFRYIFITYKSCCPQAPCLLKPWVLVL